MTMTSSGGAANGQPTERGGRPSALGFIAVASLVLALALGAVPAQGAASAGISSQAVIARAPLAEPLVRTAPTTPTEDLALAQAVTGFERRTSADDYGPLTAFVARYPNSGWTPAVLTNLGLTYLHDGYFSRAIDAWRQAWTLGKGAGEPHAKAVVDRAVGELARLYASLGQFDKLAALFDEIGTRPISGSATEAVQTARETLTLVGKDPRHLFNCGPIALKLVMLALDPRDQRGAGLQWYRAGPNGTSLAELSGLATKANSSYRVVYRTPGQPVPFPSIVHWKVGHYGAIVGRANGRYHVEDPAISGGVWVTQAALDAEASGYFLIPASAQSDAGWRAVDLDEAARVWGKGQTTGTAPGAVHKGPTAHNKGGNPPKRPAKEPGTPPKPDCKMCVYDIVESNVSVTISDTPVGYTPPIGPSPAVTITYNQREDSQPANFGYYNISPKWTLNWLDYVVDDPTNPGANVSRYMPEGGANFYSGYNSGTGQFVAQDDDGSILVLVSTSPITYRRQLADGGVQIYAQSNGAASYPRDIFLTQVIDPQGNAVTLNYDGQMRLTSLTDAAGRQTTLSYGNTNPLLVTQVTDPFGRSASLAYDTSGRLSSITDVIGLTSSFAYDANSLVDSLTTPYGATNFTYTAPGAAGPPRFVQVADPLGYHEREEWLEPAPIPDSDPANTVPTGMPLSPTNQYLTYRDSFYWDKNAYVVAGCTPTGGCDYTKARDTHFLHVPNQSIKSTSVESVKYPLENRIWYQYPGQTNSIYAGTFQSPIAQGRVLDDGTTQLTQATYDTAGYFKLTQTIDPLGRTTSFGYAANRIDLTTITQLVSGVQTTLDQYTWNGQHRPLTHIDAAGKTTTFTYNGAGQLATATNALNQKTTYAYNTTGDLTSITNANNLTQASYTYDAFDRVATFTDSEGWMVSFAYDAADRITTVTYPDSTTEVYTYNKLDLASYQDRLGRTWTYAHDADRRLTSTTDPSTHQIIYAYNPSNELTSLTDANSHVTGWAYDVEGRLTTKTYADNSTLTFTYEATTSRLKSTTDALSQMRQIAYAKDDQVTGFTYASAVHATPSVTFAYDPFFPRRTSMTDGSGTTTYTYVPAGTLGALQVQQVTTPLTNGTIAYTYDALGRLSTRTVAGQGAESYGYDPIGRVTSHGDDLGSFTLAWLG